jgi:hypothetical protein
LEKSERFTAEGFKAGAWPEVLLLTVARPRGIHTRFPILPAIVAGHPERFFLKRAERDAMSLVSLTNYGADVITPARKMSKLFRAASGPETGQARLRRMFRAGRASGLYLDSLLPSTLDVE